MGTHLLFKHWAALHPLEGQVPQSIRFPHSSAVAPHWEPTSAHVFGTHPSGPASVTPLEVEEDELLVVEEDPDVVLVVEADVVLVAVAPPPSPPEPELRELDDRIPPVPVVPEPSSSTTTFEQAAIAITGSRTTKDNQAPYIEGPAGSVRLPKGKLH
jgi:hypothetical protein